MELRIEQAGLEVRNDVYYVGHRCGDPVYDLIMSIQR
jgi:hypothetical protein